MPDFTATAPGKVILFGEHAVVYGKPAIAVPVEQVRVRVIARAALRQAPGSVRIQAAEIGLDASLDELPVDHPLAAALRLALQKLDIQRPPACTLKIISTIPVAAGLGSGAAVSVALTRAYTAFLGRSLGHADTCEIAFEVEKLHHGTPSGIDNTVITYAMPVYFVRGQPAQTFKVARPFTILIGDTGISSPTALAVAEVRKAWHRDVGTYESYFEAIGSLVDSARQMIETGIVEALGPLMDANHGLLQKIGTSSPELDRLVETARRAGAWGAKLSGGGRGGNMIAIIPPARAVEIAQALQKAGAVRTIITQVA